jgi:tetratricopeptide (TPR) repeat protein
LGRYEEAAVEAYKAFELDPLSPGIVRCLTAVPFYLGRKFERAAEVLREVAASDPQLFFARLFLGYCLCALGKYDEAAAELQIASRVSGESDTSVSRLGFCYGLANRVGDARSMLSRLEQASRSRYVAPVQFVYLHLGLGHVDETFRYLEKCFQERSDYLVFLAQQPLFDSIRKDSRFADLTRRMQHLQERSLSAASR